MAGVKSRLRNERCRQPCQQPLQRTLKPCGWLTALPGVKVQRAQSPAENSQAKTRSQHKHHSGKGQMQMRPQMLAVCWLMYSGAFPQVCAVRIPALILQQTSANVSKEAFGSALFTYNNHNQLLPFISPRPLKRGETAWFPGLLNKTAALTSSPPISILCQLHLTN